VAIAALVLWMCTIAVGSYLLATAARSANRDSASLESVSVPAGPARDRDRFDPPSLQRAKSEPLPGMRDLAEFTHPALAIIGFAFWLGYVISRDRLFAAIGLGLLLGAICAGVSLFTVNTRAARRAAATDAADGSDAASADATMLSYSPRVLTLHAVGAALTLLFTALIVARV
jgi:hypothetical protein